jgi:hypothetical protein
VDVRLLCLSPNWLGSRGRCVTARRAVCLIKGAQGLCRRSVRRPARSGWPRFGAISPPLTTPVGSMIPIAEPPTRRITRRKGTNEPLDRASSLRRVLAGF